TLSSVSLFFNDPATTEIYTLSLHDALPISVRALLARGGPRVSHVYGPTERDRKSTRLNSSHPSISYAVFCLKKKKKHSVESLSRPVLLSAAWGAAVMHSG